MPEELALQTKILIVDDDQTIAEVLKDLISAPERSVNVCYDGLSAIESTQKSFYDLIIVDLVMPRVGKMPLIR
jgi:DNA-binding response OmpR family regulator